MPTTPTDQLETFANPELTRDYTIWSFRNRGAFHEAVTNEIADHLESTLRPRFLRLTARFNARGGIYTTVVAERRQGGWQPKPPIALP